MTSRRHLSLPPHPFALIPPTVQRSSCLGSSFCGFPCDGDSLVPRMLLDHYPNPSPQCGMSYLTDSGGSHLKAACFKRLHHRAEGLVWALHSWERTCCVQDRHGFCCAKFSYARKIWARITLMWLTLCLNHASTCHVSACSETFLVSCGTFQKGSSSNLSWTQMRRTLSWLTLRQKTQFLVPEQLIWVSSVNCE